MFLVAYQAFTALVIFNFFYREKLSVASSRVSLFVNIFTCNSVVVQNAWEKDYKGRRSIASSL